MKATDARAARKKTLAGAVHTPDGSIARVRLKLKRGRWTVDDADIWPASDGLRTARRLSRGAALGVETDWRGNANGAAKIRTAEPPLTGANTDVTPYFDPEKYDPLLEMLSGCITSLTAEDSFLLTLPLAFCAAPPSSFLSIYYDAGLAKFGVVIGKKLEAAFTFPCDGAAGVEAAAGRVRRYWSRSLKRDDFPQKAVIIDKAGHEELSIDNPDDIDTERLALPKEINNDGVMKAAGAALALSYPAPMFKLPPRYGFRAYRPLLITASAVLFCLSLTATAALALLNAHAGKTLAKSENIYRSKLNENKTLQDLNKTAEELSNKILSIQKAHTRTTRWGELLLLLSEIRPDDLFIDKLGTDDAKGSANSMRLALSGWARAETPVTEFISGLQSSGFISGVSLSSMERDAKNKNICRFRIQCVIQLSSD